MASTYDSISPYTFRAEDQAAQEQQNRLDVATVNAVGRVMGSRGQQAPSQSPTFGGGAGANQGSLPTPSQMGVGQNQAASNPAPTQAPAQAGPRDSFLEMQRSLDPLAIATERATMGQLNNPTEAFDLGAARAVENLDAAQRTNRESLRDDLLRTYGGNASQVMPALQDAEQGAILERRKLTGDLTAARAEASTKGIASAIQNALGLLGQRSNERVSQAQITSSENIAAAGRASNESIAALDRAVQERMQQAGISAEAARAQLDREVQERMQQRGISAEMALAQLTRESQERMQQRGQTFEAAQAELTRAANAAMQKTGIDATAALEASRQTFEAAQAQAGYVQAKDLETMRADLQTKLTQMGIDANTAAQLADQQFSIIRDQQAQASSEKIAGMQIGSQERLQASQQAFQSSLADLERAAAAAMQKTGIDATAALQASQQEFQMIMQDKGFVQTKELESLRNTFAENLQKAGFDQQTAMQLADQNFKTLQAKNEQDFSAAQAQVQRDWQAGQNLQSIDLQKTLQATEIAAQAARDKLNATLQLDLEDKRAGYQSALQVADQVFQRTMQATQNDQAKALQASQQAFETEMSKAGFSQQQILQSQQLSAAAVQADKALSQQWAMFTIQQAQQDEQFAQQLGIEKEKLTAQKDQINSQIGIALKQLGMQEEQWNQQKEDAAYARELEALAMGMQVAGEDEDTLKIFSDRMVKVLGTQLGLDPARLEAAMASVAGGTGDTGSSGAAPASNQAIQNAQDAAATMYDKLPATTDMEKVTAAISGMASLKPGTSIRASAGRKLLQLPGGAANINPVYAKFGGIEMPYSAKTQEGADYAAFANLIDLGLSEQQAFKVATQAIGDARMKTAYKALTGKDWQ